MSCHFFISSKYRNRIKFQSPGFFNVPFQNRNISSPVVNGFTSINPLAALPLYNFSFPSGSSTQNTIPSSIISMDGTKLLLDSTTLQEYSVVNLFVGFAIEVFIGDSSFQRQIIAFDPILCQVTVNISFPFNLNTDTSIPCSIINNSTDSVITLNGSISLTNSFFYTSTNNLFLYNLNQNRVLSCNVSFDTENSTSLCTLNNNETFTSSTVPFSYNDEYFLFSGGEKQPLLCSKLLPLPSSYSVSQLYSLQINTLTVLNTGTSSWEDNQRVIFLPNKPAYPNDGESILLSNYHQYSLKGMSDTGGVLVSKDNIELASIGSEQVFEVDNTLSYLVFPIPSDAANEIQFLMPTEKPTLIRVTSINMAFRISSPTTDNSVESLEAKAGSYINQFFFYPILLSNQYYFDESTNKFVLESNQTLMNRFSSTTSNGSSSNSLKQQCEKNGTLLIRDSIVLPDTTTSTIVIFTDLMMDTSKLDKYTTVLSDTSTVLPPTLLNCLIIPFTRDGFSSFESSFQSMISFPRSSTSTSISSLSSISSSSKYEYPSKLELKK